MARECIDYKNIVIDDLNLSPKELFAALDEAVLVALLEDWGLHGPMQCIEGIAVQTLVKYMSL